jgi:hypothetical protein
MRLHRGLCYWVINAINSFEILADRARRCCLYVRGLASLFICGQSRAALPAV